MMHEDLAEPEQISRVPTRYLGGAPNTRPHRHSGLSGTMPHIPRGVTSEMDDVNATTSVASASTLRRRRLLAIFGRMMARFYERHERKWSIGRWNCIVCQQRIVAWAWVPSVIAGATTHALSEIGGAMHEACVSSSMWETVLHYERLARAGYACDLNSLQFGMKPR